MRLLIIATLCLSAFSTQAQSPSKQEQAFVDALNKLVTIAPQDIWCNGELMKLDSPFRLDGELLTVTWVCNTDSTWSKTRLTVPISKVRSVEWDLYLVLVCDERDAVEIHESRSDNPEWRLAEQTHLLHITPVSEENKKQMKAKKEIEKAFAGLR